MTQVQRKEAAGAADTAAYEQTRFGRRRVSKLPAWMATLLWLVAIPALFIYRWLRRSWAS